MIRRWLFVALCGLWLISCRSVEIPQISKNKFKCDQLDWFEIGRNDSVLGQQSTGQIEKASDCEGFSERNKEQYTNGWYSGLDVFCTRSQGFAFGRTGGEYKNICPPSKQEDFLAGFKKGQQVFSYEKDNQEIRKQLEEAEQASADQKESLSSEALQKKVAELETRLELNRALIVEIQKELDDSSTQ